MDGQLLEYGNFCPKVLGLDIVHLSAHFVALVVPCGIFDQDYENSIDFCNRSIFHVIVAEDVTWQCDVATFKGEKR